MANNSDKLVRYKVGLYGWVNLPTPSTYKMTYTHIENSYRDLSGKLHRTFVRKNLAKLELGWNMLNDDDLKKLQDVYDYSSVNLEFTDNKGNRIVKTMYASPLESDTTGIDVETLKMIINTDVSMSFIEV